MYTPCGINGHVRLIVLSDTLAAGASFNSFNSFTTEVASAQQKASRRSVWAISLQNCDEPTAEYDMAGACERTTGSSVGARSVILQYCKDALATKNVKVGIISWMCGYTHYNIAGLLRYKQKSTPILSRPAGTFTVTELKVLSDQGKQQLRGTAPETRRTHGELRSAGPVRAQSKECVGVEVTD